MHTQKQKSRVSIVIPVYNEAATLHACLAAISQQTVKPFEVIVVDNNSSDGTVAIAESYPFVKVLHETRQGVIFARDTGFNFAHGDIIGRIDADTIITANWVETLQKIFATNSVDAVSGSAVYHDIALAKVSNKIDLVLRRYLARVLGRSVALQGANMAIRRRTWRSIRGSLCSIGGMHEDLDLCIHANQMGHRIVFDESLVASLAFRQAGSSFADFKQYVMLNPRTYSMHGLKIQRHMYPVIALAIISFPAIKIAHNGYDPLTGKFSIEKLLDVTTERTRVNPATFVE